MAVRLFLYILLTQIVVSVTLASSTYDGSDIVYTTAKSRMTSDDTHRVDPSEMSTHKGSSTKSAMATMQVSTDEQKMDTYTTTSHKPGSDDLSDQETPPIIIHPESSATVIVDSRGGKKFTYQCKANGNPRPSYRWYRGGVEVTERGDYIKAYRNGTLMIKDFSDREDGWYQCRATNKYGTSLSNVFHLVKETDIARVDENSTTTTLKPYQSFSVPCSNVPVTYPKVRIRWYNANNDQIPTTDRIGQDESGTLHLAYVVKEDHDRVFSCALLNSRSQTSTIWVTQMGHLLITDQNTVLVAKRPTIQYITDQVEAIMGKEVILECFIAGVPLANIRWKNSSNHDIIGNQNPRFQLSDFNRKLTVFNVSENDEGTFTCMGSNTADSVTGRLTVNVTSPPFAIPNGALVSQTVPDNRVATLKCKTKAAPFESVDRPKWYRNGYLLTRDNLPDFNRYKFNTDMTELTISDLEKEIDIANYQCNVTNSKGFAFFDAYLRVIDSIKITKQPKNMTIIEPDDIVDFTVRAIGDRCCSINTLWYFNSSQININQPPFVFNTSTDSLYFDAASVPLEKLKDWLGTYTCRVSDYYQDVSVNVVVRLKGDDKKPEPVTATKANIGLWWVGLLCGVVAIAIAVIIILVIVYKRKNPGETYKLEQQELKHNLNPEEDLLNQSFQDI